MFDSTGLLLSLI